MELSNMALEIT